MKHSRLSALLVLALILGHSASAQTLYVPNGSVGVSANGFVGIGTSSPDATLMVAGDLHLQRPGGSSYYIQTPASDTRIFTYGAFRLLLGSNGQINQLVLVSSGNVGIGTINPTCRLDVINDNYNAIRAMGNSGNSIGIYVTDTYPGGRQWAMISSGGGPAPVGSFVLWDDSGGAGARLTIAPSGNIGIGTTVPGNRLEITGTNAAAASSGTAANGGTRISGAGTSIVLDSGVVGANTHAWLQARDSTSYVANYNLALNPNGGNIGIGTTPPGAALDIAGGSNYTNTNPTYQLFNGGDRVVQVRSPNQSVLSLLSDTNVDGGTIGGVYFGRTLGQGDAWINLIGIRAVQGGGTGPVVVGDLTIRGSTRGEILRVMGDSGNVGIGTTNPTQKLSVNGTVQAKEVIVQTGWSDYVFDSDYRLAPLSEVEQHIKAEKHLPGIPSAKQVAEQGISVGEMQAKLLAKIEELTLHQIELEKRVVQLESENHGLRKAQK